MDGIRMGKIMRCTQLYEQLLKSGYTKNSRSSIPCKYPIFSSIWENPDIYQ